MKLEHLLMIQGGYYFITGLWPIISITTFEKITGPKVDKWLVQSFGALTLSISISLLVASYEGTAGYSALILSIGTAISFIFCEIIFCLKGFISYVYLIDAILHVILLWYLFFHIA